MALSWLNLVCALMAAIIKKSRPWRSSPRPRHAAADARQSGLWQPPQQAVAKLYKCRWQVELFFKWIKQHLRIKAFFGTSENAVKSQIWIAVSVYVLVAIVKKRLALAASLYEILQVLSLTLFEKTPVNGLFDSGRSHNILAQYPNQLNLFN
jgi:hypothetical protein